jgi:pantetheine-phosphate adenylyltransferase/dephospho-CoA kinase
MKIVVTGGIGSGKTTVCEMLSNELGIKYYSFDSLVHWLYTHSTSLMDELKKNFGTVDRKEISKIVFQDAIAREQLEHIFAPYINQEIDQLFWTMDDFIFEFPLLVEKGKHYIHMFDAIITVIASPSLQILRVAERDGKDRDHILAIMKSQTNDDDRVSVSDAIIYNGGGASEDKSYLKHEIKRAVDVVKRKMLKDKKIGIVSGSFDPITLGHTWVIQKALDVVDHVIVAVAHNPTKKYLLSQEDRESLVQQSLTEVLTPEQLTRVSINVLPASELLVSYAQQVNAKFIFRGLRGTPDFEYENQLNLLQKKIAPDIETIFLITPRELVEISSSLIKGSLALREWERVAKSYIPNCVFEKLKEIHG